MTEDTQRNLFSDPQHSSKYLVIRRRKFTVRFHLLTGVNVNCISEPQHRLLFILQYMNSHVITASFPKKVMASGSALVPSYYMDYSNYCNKCRVCS